ncbi:MAG: OmpA family protein [Polaromonas sp.]|nr:OmpA family protein [Polaromonas sp.]
MSSQDDDGPQGLVLWVVFGLVALVIALVVGVSVYQRGKMAAAPKTAVAAAMTVLPVNDVANAAQNAMDAASVKVENGVVKFYFASGKSDLAAGANAALADVIIGAKEGKKLVISGYHDATGSAAKNAELAKLRAVAVRDALKVSGVSDDKIELKKPEELKATGSDAEARRVEVAVQ